MATLKQRLDRVERDQAVRAAPRITGFAVRAWGEPIPDGAIRVGQWFRLVPDAQELQQQRQPDDPTRTTP